MTIAKSLVVTALLFSLYAAQAQEFPRSETLALVLHPETYHKRWAAANDPAAAAVLSTLGAKVRDTDHGVLLIRLSRKSAAVRAGLRKGDVITAVDGRPIANILELAGELVNRESGSKVKLSVVRAGGSPAEMTLVLP